MESISLIGLGVMGSNLVLNLVDRGYTVNVFNRTLSKVTELEKLSEKIIGHLSLKDLVKNTRSTRVILLEVKAGQVVDDYLLELDELLNSNDIVIDCGNSDYSDTIRRFKSHKYRYVGMGVSGGELGARYGPSLMVGCDQIVYDIIRPMLESICAKGTNGPCCGLMGSKGAGHFVKIVHNGIEYVEMQLLQEIFNIFINDENHNRSEKLYELFNKGRLQSYLVTACCSILKKKDSNGFIIDQILDKAEQKGTGKMCVLTSLEIGSEINSMAEAVFARFISNKKTERMAFSKLKSVQSISGKSIIEPSDECIEKAFYLCKAVSYAQGFNLLSNMKKMHGWIYTIKDLCRVWEEGCILRSVFLKTLREVSDDYPIEQSKLFIDILEECYESLNIVCIYLIQKGIYAPVFTSCLQWINGMGMEVNGSLIQAMRDYFGRHGVILQNGETKNIAWDY